MKVYCRVELFLIKVYCRVKLFIIKVYCRVALSCGGYESRLSLKNFSRQGEE